MTVALARVTLSPQGPSARSPVAVAPTGDTMFPPWTPFLPPGEPSGSPETAPGRLRPPGFTITPRNARVVHEAYRETRTNVANHARGETAPCV